MGKLSDEHVDEILRLSATGARVVDIRDQLAEGIRTGSGLQLAPVKVDEGSVRHHLRSKADRVNAWRVEMYGSAMQDPIAWAGWRMREYRKLYELALSATVLNAKTGKQVPRPDVRTAASILRDVATELATMTPKETTQHLHLHGKGAPELAATLAEKLSEYARAGALPEAIQVLRGSAPGLDLAPIEATVVEPAQEQPAAPAADAEQTPEPPRAPQGSEGR